jgi:hypothetical protein
MTFQKLIKYLEIVKNLRANLENVFDYCVSFKIEQKLKAIQKLLNVNQN